jgi:hypothetical protein
MKNHVQHVTIHVRFDYSASSFVAQRFIAHRPSLRTQPPHPSPIAKTYASPSLSTSGFQQPGCLQSLREVIPQIYIPWGALHIQLGLLTAGLPAAVPAVYITVRTSRRGLSCRVIHWVGVFCASNKRMLPVGRPVLLVEQSFYGHELFNNYGSFYGGRSFFCWSSDLYHSIYLAAGLFFFGFFVSDALLVLLVSARVFGSYVCG